MINGYTYKRLYYRTYEYVWSNVVTQEEFYGYLREDVSDKKVYSLLAQSFACQESEEEYLLYDFSRQIGDTSTMCIMSLISWPAVLEEIHQEVLFGKQRKLYHYDDEQFDLIEGIGHEGGLMEPTDDASPYNHHYLYDYCRGTDEECGVWTKVDENPGQHAFTIYPNPASNLVRIHVSDTRRHSLERKLVISDVYGRCVREVNSPAEDIKLDISDLSDGMYLITFREGNRAITSRKLFIAR